MADPKVFGSQSQSGAPSQNPPPYDVPLRRAGSSDPKESPDYEEALKEIGGVLLDAIGESIKVRWPNKHRPRMSSKRYATHEGFPRPARSIEDIAHLSSQIEAEMRGVFSTDQYADGNGKKRTIEHQRHNNIVIPLSWYEKIRREYRGVPRAYIEAIQLLGFIVFAYRRKDFIRNHLFRPEPKQFEKLFDLRRDTRKAAMQHLEQQGLIYRIVIRGLVPWYDNQDATPGSYLFVVPRPGKIRQITYPTLNRYSGKVPEEQESE